MKVDEFIRSVSGFLDLTGAEQVDYFVYYLTEVQNAESATAKAVDQCFRDGDLGPYSRIAPYLSENVGGKAKKFVKSGTGYRLERRYLEAVKSQLGAEPKQVQVAKSLIDRLTQVTDVREKAFLREALDCYRVEAYRATIIMVWILIMDHMARYVFTHYLGPFNVALAANPEKRLKTVTSANQFTEMDESKFILVMRSAGIISNDVRKILDEKLGTRNSAAHPSDIHFDGHKATEFASDLISNVLLKYQI